MKHLRNILSCACLAAAVIGTLVVAMLVYLGSRLGGMSKAQARGYARDILQAIVDV